MGFLDTLLGRDASDTSNAAAADRDAKERAAIGNLNAAGDQFANDFSALSDRFSPYVEGGKSALARLLEGLGLGGDPSKFTAAYRSTPGYAAGLETGSRAITGNAAARGMLNSGSTLKALDRFGSDYEDQRVNDYLDRLAGVAGSGQTATGQQVSTAGTGLQGRLGTRTTAYGGAMNNAGTIGEGMIAGANAESSGIQNLLNFGGNIAGRALGGGFGTNLSNLLFGKK